MQIKLTERVAFRGPLGGARSVSNRDHGHMVRFAREVTCTANTRVVNRNVICVLVFLKLIFNVKVFQQAKFSINIHVEEARGERDHEFFLKLAVCAISAFVYINLLLV